MSNQLEQDQERWEQDQRMTKQEAALPPVRSKPLLAVSFSDFWHRKWPHQTRDVKRLEKSAHYAGCQEAFLEGARAAFLLRAMVETDGYVGGASRLADKWLNESWGDGK